MDKLPSENGFTVQDIIHWDPERLLSYIQVKLSKLSRPLSVGDAQGFLDAEIDGSVFFTGAGDPAFFRKASLSFGASVKLAELSGKIVGRNSNSEKTGLTWSSDNTFETLPLKCKIDPDLWELSNRASQRRIQIYQKCLSLSSEELSDPAFVTKLPFPFVFRTLPKRFKFEAEQGEHNWVYTGREKFAELLHKLEEVRESPQNSGFWLYGTRGYGKSHLLAALACYLTARRERVVYIPDCRECLRNPVPYIKAAILFALGDHDQRESIMLLNSMEMIYSYLESVKNVILIIDQMNALACLTGDSPELKKKKGKLEVWLLRYRATHKCILSTSANYKAYLESETTQASELRLHVYGGFTTKEMEHWWERNSDIVVDGNNIRGGYTKDEVEDQTGCIPLLLNSCLVNGEIDLGVDILNKVWTQVQAFISHTKRTVNQFGWDQYCEYVNACIGHRATPAGVGPDLIDHRYFYEWRPTSATPYAVGTYACGIARDAAVKQLRKYGKNKFGDRDFLKALDDYINNEAVTGFFIEENILSTISLSGLEIGRNLSRPMDTQMFCGYPTFTITEHPILYCPMQFNFRAIDGIIVRFDLSDQSNGKMGKCFLFPLQITIAKSHADSEREFFRDWSQWIQNLEDYNLEVVFLWISAKEPWERKVKRYPGYISKNIHIRDVNRDTWERYVRALKSKNGRGQAEVVVARKGVLGKRGTREKEDMKDQSDCERVIKRGRKNKITSSDRVEGSDGRSRWAGRTRSAQ